MTDPYERKKTYAERFGDCKPGEDGIGNLLNLERAREIVRLHNEDVYSKDCDLVNDIAKALDAVRSETIEEMLKRCPVCKGSGQYYIGIDADEVAQCEWCDKIQSALKGNGNE